MPKLAGLELTRAVRAEPRLRGLRNAVVWDAWAALCTAVHPVDQGLLTDSRFRAGFRTLAARVKQRVRTRLRRS